MGNTLLAFEENNWIKNLKKQTNSILWIFDITKVSKNYYACSQHHHKREAYNKLSLSYFKKKKTKEKKSREKIFIKLQ